VGNKLLGDSAFSPQNRIAFRPAIINLYRLTSSK